MNTSIQMPAEQRLQDYLSRLATVLGHADRHERLAGYCTGLLLPGERKSVEPMAARLDPANVPRLHQALHHFVASAAWSDAALLAAVREQVLPALTRHGPMTAWILDDTGFPKKGTHSVGVTRQYCGQLGKQENCQVAVSLSLANDHGSLPIAFDLYLPEDWTDDPLRRANAGVPQDLVFRTKPQIAEQQIRRALADGIRPGVILGDAGYGIDTKFRTALTGLSLRYVLGVQSSLGIWPPGSGPLPSKPWSGKSRPPKLQRRNAEHQPVSANDLAIGLPPEAWQMVGWREGSQGELQGRFAALRVRPSHRDYWRAEPHPIEWLLIEWPEGEKEPSKYWLSTLPETTALVDLVHLAKLRWRIERDYQELKQELGLDHYEGRGWRGFHHHASLCIAAYGFLIRERSLFPPDHQVRWKAAALSEGWRPRGRGHADPARASYSVLHRLRTPLPDRCLGAPPAPLSMLSRQHSTDVPIGDLMTQ